MSAWSDYKAGLLTEAEYNGICRREGMNDRSRLWAEGHDWDDEEVFEEDDIDEF